MSAEPSQTQSQPHAADDELNILAGTCYCLFAYDVGFGIDLDEADRRVTAAIAKQRARMRRKRRAPQYFEYDPPPLRITLEAPPVKVGPWRTAGQIEVVVYDFGAVAITYAIPLRGPLQGLLKLADELWDHAELLRCSRSAVEKLLETIRPAVTRPGVSELVEDYVIYQIERARPELDVDRIVERHAQPLAQIMRAEPGRLSDQEVSDALACRLSYGPDDLVLVDWNAAMVFDRDAEDVRVVLEYANVELLELRLLDDQLDHDLDEAYEVVSRPERPWWRALDSRSEELRRIAGLQMDSALLFEGVNNALKLLGDQYLARLYRLTSERLHLNQWDASILRKLQTLEGLYERLSDERSNRRIEVLEWIIILLIAVSIVLPFFTDLSH